MTHRGKLADELEAAGIPVTCYDLSTWNLPLMLWRLRSALRNTRPAIVQTFLYHANILGRIAARDWLASATVVSGIRVAEKRSRFRLWLDRVTDRFVQRHVCVSQSVAKFSHEVGGLPLAKLDVVPNGVDVDRFAKAKPADLSQFGVPRDAFVVLSVGRLEEQKAPDMLLEAVSPLLPPNDNLHLLYVGNGPLESTLRDRISELARSADRVHFAGSVSGTFPASCEPAAVWL